MSLTTERRRFQNGPISNTWPTSRSFKEKMITVV